MKYTYEEYETFYYLHKLLPNLRHLGDFADNMRWFNKICHHSPLIPNPGGNRESKAGMEKFNQCMEKFLAKQSAGYLEQSVSRPRQNIQVLSQLFRLSEPERKLLVFLITARKNRCLNRVLQRFQHDYMDNKDFLETIAEIPSGAISGLFKATAPLIRLGILQRRGFSGDICTSPWVEDFANNTQADKVSLCKSILGSSLEETVSLRAKDFSYVDGVDLALRLIKQAKHTKGFNILLYGGPGTGKTSFAKLLAKAAKLVLYPVGESHEGEVERNYRLQQFYRKQFLLEKIKGTCLLFDEGEDIFSSQETHANKVEINTLLENNEVPVIWTTNKIHRMDPAFIRRFTLAIYFNKPPVEVRQKIWNKYLAESKLSYTKKDTLFLAQHYEVPPSMIAGATQAARLAKGGLNTVKDHLSFMMQALHGGYKKPEENKMKNKFSPLLIHADTDLQTLTEQLKGLGRLDFSLCLYGASGTGKSAYARYLAEELGLDVLHCRASDLISPYVGATEQNIAKAFAQAKENKALLVFDEADSFLRDRALAAHSWEISSVNEMLTWMETHPYPFICTTNLMDTLDPASLRRFSFKVKYDFLTAEQVKEAFSFFFGLHVEKKDIIGLDKLTPGDFTLVKNKAEILGKSSQIDALKDMLANEQKLKQHAVGHSIGFAV